MKPITIAGARSMLAVAKSFNHPDRTLYERILTTAVAYEKAREEAEEFKIRCAKLTMERDALVRELDALRAEWAEEDL